MIEEFEVIDAFAARRAPQAIGGEVRRRLEQIRAQVADAVRRIELPAPSAVGM
jgi:hypothetical protein